MTVFLPPRGQLGTGGDRSSGWRFSPYYRELPRRPIWE
jgi:hypothetical protein